MSTSHRDLIISYHELIKVRQKNPADTFPTVIGVGAGRCGTTTLYNILAKCPAVYVSPIKEVNFFGRPRISKDLYSLYFMGRATEEHVCEISPYYLTQDGVAAQIYSMLGPIRIIIQIRDPVERFMSHFRHHYDLHKIEDFGNYAEMATSNIRLPEINRSHNWFSPAKALAQSLYYDAIKNYVEIFGADNVLIIDYPELEKPERICRAISGFLDVYVASPSVTVSNASRKFDGELNPVHVQQLVEFFGDDYDRVLKNETFMKSYRRWCS